VVARAGPGQLVGDFFPPLPGRHFLAVEVLVYFSEVHPLRLVGFEQPSQA
jgi:hypothetical protein